MFDDQQDKILKKVEDLFFRLGIKSLTMDDIAKELGISKKTLYQFVSSKEDLVSKVLERHVQEDCDKARKLHESATDAIDELMKVVEYNALDLGRIKSNIIFELQRFYPEAWEKIETYNWTFMQRIVLENLQWGIQDGLFRNDFNPEIVAKMHLASMFTAFDDRIFPKPTYSLRIIFKEYMLHYLHGILSEKGRKLFSKKYAPMITTN